MKRSNFFNARIGILVFAILTVSLFVIAETSAAGRGIVYKTSSQTNSNSQRRKKPKKVVKPKMNMSQRSPISPGNWGGNGIRLVVGSNSTSIEYDCAEGEITEILTVDKSGNFDAKGVHIRQMGGPIREDHPYKREPARYTGRISGSQMTLKVTLTDKETLIGDFQLELGKNVRLHKCL